MITQRSLLWNALLALLAGFALAGSAPAASGSPSSDFAAAEAAAIAEADANGDGKLTPEEFANHNLILRQKLEALHFTRLDTNGDGVLTADELSAGRPAGCGGFPPPGPPL